MSRKVGIFCLLLAMILDVKNHFFSFSKLYKVIKSRISPQQMVGPLQNFKAKDKKGLKRIMITYWSRNILVNKDLLAGVSGQ